ncbi:hypothetical protein BV898_14037 [Hypsibius exemplaris]|uniref:SEA domain-containing protein n=1 Tax=Hypsibius exemplaris TaxID=2072580 RepID=A0A1W0W934_HYPEX|nr:hypothetical protein BV898_14037 [Hypsibius exemplaris]
MLRGWGIVFVGLWLTMMSVLLGQSSGQQGAPLANFLIRPSSGNSFSNLQKSAKSGAVTKQPTVHHHHHHHNVTTDAPPMTITTTTATTSGIDLEVSVPSLTWTSTTTTTTTTTAAAAAAVEDLTLDTSIPPAVSVNVRKDLFDNAGGGGVDLFPEFLPMENGTDMIEQLPAPVGEINGTAMPVDDLGAGSGDGEIIEGPSTTTGTVRLVSPGSTTLIPPVELAVTTATPLDGVPLDTTMTTPADHSTFLPTTRGRLGFYQFRESGSSTTSSPPTAPDLLAVDTDMVAAVAAAAATAMGTESPLPEPDVAATELSFATILSSLNDTRKLVVPVATSLPGLDWNFGSSSKSGVPESSVTSEMSVPTVELFESSNSQTFASPPRTSQPTVFTPFEQDWNSGTPSSAILPTSQDSVPVAVPTAAEVIESLISPAVVATQPPIAAFAPFQPDGNFAAPTDGFPSVSLSPLESETTVSPQLETLLPVNSEAFEATVPPPDDAAVARHHSKVLDVAAPSVSSPMANHTLRWVSESETFTTETPSLDPNAVFAETGGSPLNPDVPFAPAPAPNFPSRQGRILEDDLDNVKSTTASHPRRTTFHRRVTSTTRRRTTAVPWPSYPTFPPGYSTTLRPIVADSLENSTVWPDTLSGNWTATKENSTQTSLTVENATAWNFPLLPEQRNVNQISGESEKVAGHEGWLPFTIPDTKLAQFLFSTLLPSVTDSVGTTISPNPTDTPNATSAPAVPTTTRYHTRKTHVTHRRPITATVSGSAVTDVPEWPVVDLITTPSFDIGKPVATTPTTSVGTTTTTTTGLPVPVATVTAVDSTTVAVRPDGNTTYPRPLLFWNDKPGSNVGGSAESGGGGETTRKLFADDTDGLQWPTANTNEQQGNGITAANQNISRDALDNLVTVVLKFVGQADFLFNDTDKKTLAELIFWPIIHESGGIKKSTALAGQVVRRDVTAVDGSRDAAAGGDVAVVPWPILRFMAKTPKFIDGVWLITAYVTYKDANSTVMPRSRLISLFYDAELKLMTKMNMQLARVFPGLPTFPLNITDSRHHTQNDYHPLFERFSSLFIPLIVLAAICAFVAIITVVCLVKKAQRNETDNKEKLHRPPGMLGEDNPLSDDVIKHGERSRPASSNATMPVGTSANEMYETEGWVVPLDSAAYAVPQKRTKPEEEDTKL